MTDETVPIEELQAKVGVLESDRRNRGWLRLLVAAGAIVALTLVGTWVQTQNARSIERERKARVASEQAFCGIIVLLDNAWHTLPPTTPSGRQLAAAVSTARVVNHCPPRQGKP